ncbi:MAG TPA: DUF1080 domain-containing protein [Lacunisphaera sp.]|nr:DUF1080 domain-containing protein [Lacunisphaera sp.]
MRCPTLACLVVSLLVIAAKAAPPAAPLFKGSDFAGWEYVGPAGTAIASVCTVQPDGVIAAAGQPVGFISTTASYANYSLHAEWRWPGKPGNGGVLVHISSGPKDRAWPLSFQVQTKNKSAGDLLPMAGATFAEPLTSAPGAATAIKAHTAADSEKPAGEWNSCDVTCRGDTIEVTINGVVQNRVTGCSLKDGKVGFQFEGAPFELRAVTLTKLE